MLAIRQAVWTLAVIGCLAHAVLGSDPPPAGLTAYVGPTNGSALCDVDPTWVPFESLAQVVEQPASYPTIVICGGTYNTAADSGIVFSASTTISAIGAPVVIDCDNERFGWGFQTGTTCAIHNVTFVGCRGAFAIGLPPPQGDAQAGTLSQQSTLQVTHGGASDAHADLMPTEQAPTALTVLLAEWVTLRDCGCFRDASTLPPGIGSTAMHSSVSLEGAASASFLHLQWSAPADFAEGPHANDTVLLYAGPGTSLTVEYVAITAAFAPLIHSDGASALHVRNASISDVMQLIYHRPAPPSLHEEPQPRASISISTGVLLVGRASSLHLFDVSGADVQLNNAVFSGMSGDRLGSMGTFHRCTGDIVHVSWHLAARTQPSLVLSNSTFRMDTVQVNGAGHFDDPAILLAGSETSVRAESLWLSNSPFGLAVQDGAHMEVEDLRASFPTESSELRPFMICRSGANCTVRTFLKVHAFSNPLFGVSNARLSVFDGTLDDETGPLLVVSDEPLDAHTQPSVVLVDTVHVADPDKMARLPFLSAVGAGVTAEERAQLTIRNMTFTWGMRLLKVSASSVWMQDVIVKDMTLAGSPLVIVAGGSDVTFDRLQLVDMSLVEGSTDGQAAFEVMDSRLAIRNSSLHSVLVQTTQVIRVVRGSVHLSNSVVERIRGRLLAAHYSNVSLVDSNVSTVFSAGAGMVAFVNESSTLLVSGLVVESCRGGDGGVAYVGVGSRADVRLSAFRLNVATRAGGVFQLAPQSELVVDRSIFSDNLATNGGVMSVTANTSASFSKCIFDANTANLGGVFSVGDGRGSAALRFVNSTFTENKASAGGVGGMMGESAALFDRSTFESNEADRGGVLYVGTHANITSHDCSYRLNHAITGGVFFVDSFSGQQCTLVYERCEFHRNRARFRAAVGRVAGVAGGGSCPWADSDGLTDLRFVGCTVSRCKSIGASFVDVSACINRASILLERMDMSFPRSPIATSWIKHGANMTIVDSTLGFGHGGFAVREDARLTVHNVSFTGWEGTPLAAVIDSIGVTSLSDAVFVDCTNMRAMFGLFSIRTTVFSSGGFGVQNSQVPRQGAVLYVGQFTHVTWHGGHVARTLAREQGVLYFEKKASAEIEDVFFLSNNMGDGGAISAGGDAEITGQFTHVFVRNCTFWGNTAGAGAGIFLNNPQLWMDVIDCRFLNNTATVAGGGAVAVLDGVFQMRDSFLWNNTAASRSAIVNGGAFLVGIATNLTVLNTQVVQNQATGRGGAMCFISSTQHTYIRNVTFASNRAFMGGVLSLLLPYNQDEVRSSSGPVVIRDSEITWNEAVGGSILYVKNQTRVIPSTPPWDAGTNISSLMDTIFHLGPGVTQTSNFAIYGDYYVGDPHHIHVDGMSMLQYPGDRATLEISIRDIWNNPLMGPAVQEYRIEGFMRVEGEEGEGELIGRTTFSQMDAVAVLSLETLYAGRNVTVDVFATPHTRSELLFSNAGLYDEFPVTPLATDVTAYTRSYCPVNHQLTDLGDGLHTCYLCDSGQYSLQRECLPCPIAAENCMNLTDPLTLEYIPAAGYYVSPPGNPTHMYKCPRAQSCKLVECLANDACNACSTRCDDGYTDRLCATCASGYFRSLAGCDKCSSVWVTISVASAAAISWLLAIVLAVTGHRFLHVLFQTLVLCLLFSLNLMPIWMVFFAALLAASYVVGFAAKRLWNSRRGSEAAWASGAEVEEIIRRTELGLDDEFEEYVETDDATSSSLLSAGAVESLLYYLQALKLTGQTLGSDLSGVNLLQVGGVECFTGSSGYIWAFLLSMSMPLTITLTCLTCSLLVDVAERAWKAWKRRGWGSDVTVTEDEMAIPIEGAFHSLDQSRISIEYNSGKMEAVNATSKWTWLARGGSLALLLTSIIYFEVAGYIMSTFSCDLDEGLHHSYMVSRPEIQCYDYAPSSEWGVLFYLSMFFGLVYVVGIPVVWATILVVKYRRKELFSQSSINMFGFLFGTYKVEYWYWHMVNVLRLLVLLVIGNVLEHNAYMPSMVNVALVISLALQDWVQPYRDSYINMASSLSIIVLIGGFNLSRSEPNEAVRVMVVLANVLMLLVFMLVLALPTLRLVHHLFKRAAERFTPRKRHEVEFDRLLLQSPHHFSPECEHPLREEVGYDAEDG